MAEVSADAASCNLQVTVVPVSKAHPCLQGDAKPTLLSCSAGDLILWDRWRPLCCSITVLCPARRMSQGFEFVRQHLIVESLFVLGFDVVAVGVCLVRCQVGRLRSAVATPRCVAGPTELEPLNNSTSPHLALVSCFVTLSLLRVFVSARLDAAKFAAIGSQAHGERFAAFGRVSLNCCGTVSVFGYDCFCVLESS